MSETTWPEASDKPPVGAKRELFGLIFLLTELAVFAWFYYWKGHTWPVQVKRGIFFGPLLPQLVLIGRAWNRCFEPDRNPVRWPNGSDIQALMSNLNRVLTVFVIVCASAWMFVDRAKVMRSKTPGVVYFYRSDVADLPVEVHRRPQIHTTAQPIQLIQPIQHIGPHSRQSFAGKYRPLHSDHWGEPRRPGIELES